MRADLETLLADGKVQLLGVVRQELLSGIREEAHYERLRRSLRAFRDVELAVEDYEEAAHVSNLCRSAGIAGNPIDFLICAVAIRRGWLVFTADHDFTLYSRHLPLSLVQTR